MSLPSRPLGKAYLYTNVHSFIFGQLSKLGMEKPMSGGKKSLCHSPALVVHRLSGTWPAGTVLWPARTWASDLTVGYSCWILPSYVEICFDKKGKASYMRSDLNYGPWVLPFFFSLSHDSTFFKQQETDVNLCLQEFNIWWVLYENDKLGRMKMTGQEKIHSSQKH